MRTLRGRGGPTLIRRVTTTGVLVLGCAIVATAAAASSDTLRFTTVARGSYHEKVSGPSTSSFGYVADRIGGVFLLATPEDQPKIEALDFRKFFAIWVTIVRPTTGYSVTIKRVTLQRAGASRQACVLVAIGRPAPGRAVRQEKTVSYHIVKLRRGKLGPVTADRIVLRETSGHILYATKAPAARLGLCRT